MSRAALLTLVCFITGNLFAGEKDKRLDIYWADVEGGAGTLIVTPAGESILIDTGNPGGRDSKRIFALAQAAGLSQIDHLITTHYHIDHFGGAAELAGLIPIHNIYDNGNQNPAREKPDAAYLAIPTQKRVVLNPGDELPLRQVEGSPKMSIRCLGARRQFVPALAGAVIEPEGRALRIKDNDLTDNANSIVSLISFGDFRFFVGGDLTWNMERKLSESAGAMGEVDVYQVDHHGLDVSNNPDLLAKLRPTVAVMSNGTTKGCGTETVGTLRSIATIKAIFQIHRCLRPDGGALNTDDARIANLAEKCDGNSITLSVDPSAHQYIVRIPATQHEESFEVRGNRH